MIIFAVRFGKHLVWVPCEELETSVPCLLLQRKEATHLMIYCHGNGEDLGHIAPQVAETSRALGISVLAFEYPGYGLCVGAASENSVSLAARAAFAFALKTMCVPVERIVAFGRSIGSGSATILASENRLAALVLQSPFLSVKSLAKTLVGSVATLMINRFDNVPLHFA
jgi:alpha-beta hydrolase superfamily lysophospholipase